MSLAGHTPSLRLPATQETGGPLMQYAAVNEAGMWTPGRVQAPLPQHASAKSMLSQHNKAQTQS